MAQYDTKNGIRLSSYRKVAWLFVLVITVFSVAMITIGNLWAAIGASVGFLLGVFALQAIDLSVGLRKPDLK